MLKINKNLLKGRWLKYKDTETEFHVIPFDSSVADDERQVYQQIIGWRGVIDNKNNELEFTDENLRFVVLNSNEITVWLLEQVKKLTDELVTVLKN